MHDSQVHKTRGCREDERDGKQARLDGGLVRSCRFGASLAGRTRSGLPGPGARGDGRGGLWHPVRTYIGSLTVRTSVYGNVENQESHSLAVVASCVSVGSGGSDVRTEIGAGGVASEQVGESVLALAVVLVPIDISLLLKIGARLVAGDDALPVVAVAPPIVRIAWQHGAVTSHGVKADRDLKFQLART